MKLRARLARGERRGDARGIPRASSLAPLTIPDYELGVSRDSAMRLSVIANARDLIVGIASQLKVERLRGEQVLPDPGMLLTQPDPDEAWTETLGSVIDDCIFYGKSELLVIARDSDGYPSRARRLPPGAAYVELDPDYSKLSRVKKITIGSSTVAKEDLIRIGGPHDGILRERSAVILQALELQDSADRFATIPLPAGVLTNTGQEIGPDDAERIVAAFDAARTSGATAFLQSMTFERSQLDAADLQLVEAIAAMDTRLARIMNVPVASVAASPSGNAAAMLYQNLTMNLAALVFQAVSPYLVTVEEALTNQATPRGQSVRFATDEWLRFANVISPAAAPATVSPGGNP